jgi:hypothetical protein
MTHPKRTLLFISGWPACGETHYGEWLARRFDFHHVDLDSADASDLHSHWEKLVPARGPAFAERLQKIGDKTEVQIPSGMLRMEILEIRGALAGGELRMTELATRAFSSRSAMTRRVERMVGEGFVRRTS